MKTLTTTLVATLAVIVFAMVVGVWMGRNRRADTAVRPFLDAFQTIPPFVYLVPALALFGHQPVHRDRRRRRVRCAGGHQADRRRHPGRVPDVGGGRARGGHHGLADDQ